MLHIRQHWNIYSDFQILPASKNVKNAQCLICVNQCIYTWSKKCILIETHCRKCCIYFRVSTYRTWKFEKKKSRDKISLYMKAINYGIILAEKEKEGLEFDMFFCLLFFFPQQCPTSSLVVLAQLFVKPHGEPDWKTNQSLL